MGVLGLTSLITENKEKLLTKVDVGSCSLVVDGCGICHKLFYHSKVDFRFGGDYARFADVVVSFFEVLFKCNIKPFVVFDGSCNKDDVKHETTMQRHTQRLEMAFALSHGGGRCGKLLPLHTLSVFVSVVRRLQIDCVQCLGDADATIASIANSLRCPVLAEDSDFFIFNLQHGYVPFSGFDWQSCNGSSVPAEIYFINELLSYFPGTKAEILPLFGALSGNDFIRGSHFANFFNNLHKPHVSKKRALRITEKHCRMLGLLQWLTDKSPEDAIADMLKHIKKEKHAALRTLLANAMKMYDDAMFNRFTSFAEIRAEMVVSIERVLQSLSLPLPAWLISAYVRCDLPAAFLYVATTKRCFLPTQIEDFKMPSSQLCARPLRRLFYAILLRNAGQHDIHEFIRTERSLAKQPVDFGSELSSPLPSLDSIPTMSLAERRRLLLDACCFGGSIEDCLFDDKANSNGAAADCDDEPCDAFFTLATLYWLRCETVDVAEADFAALLLHRCRSVVSRDEACLLKKFDSATQLMDAKHNKKSGSGSDVRILHSFAVWQSILSALIWLNKLLGSPLKEPNIGELFSGRFLYNCTCYLLSHESVAKALSTLGANFGHYKRKREQLLHFFSLISKRNTLPAFVTLSSTSKKVKSYVPRRAAACENSVKSNNNLTSAISINESDDYNDEENKFAVLKVITS